MGPWSPSVGTESGGLALGAALGQALVGRAGDTGDTGDSDVRPSGPLASHWAQAQPCVCAAGPAGLPPHAPWSPWAPWGSRPGSGGCCAGTGPGGRDSGPGTLPGTQNSAERWLHAQLNIGSPGPGARRVTPASAGGDPRSWDRACTRPAGSLLPPHPVSMSSWMGSPGEIPTWLAELSSQGHHTPTAPTPLPGRTDPQGCPAPGSTGLGKQGPPRT